jgi:hypothetical protein
VRLGARTAQPEKPGSQVGVAGLLNRQLVHATRRYSAGRASSQGRSATGGVSARRDHDQDRARSSNDDGKELLLRRVKHQGFGMPIGGDALSLPYLPKAVARRYP